MDGDSPERRLRAVAPRRAEDRRREEFTDVFPQVWQHGVDVRWLTAAGIRDFQAMLGELGRLQASLPRDAPAPDEPNHDD